MNCPSCFSPMQQHTLDGQIRSVDIDLCLRCQCFWFDGYESLSLTPASTLTLFRIIGEQTARPERHQLAIAKCPRCRAHLRRVRDMQRATRFEYFKCPNDHGRLTAFFEFLKEKDFIRPLTPQQIAELRRNIQMINCSNCGAPIDLAKTSECAHCGSPLSMLDLQQAEHLIRELRHADRSTAGIPADLELQLARARADVEAAFQGLPSNTLWGEDAPVFGLVGAGLSTLARFLKGRV